MPDAMSTIRAAVSMTRRRALVIQPSARIGVPIGTGRRNSTARRAVTPQLSLSTSDQAITSSRIVVVIPPWAIPSQPSNRRSSSSSVQQRWGSRWRTRPRPLRVQRAAGEAVVRRRTRTGCRRSRSSAARVARPQMSRFWTFRASALMKSLRGPTFSPMSIVKISSAAAAFSLSTCRSVRVSGFIVVSQS